MSRIRRLNAAYPSAQVSTFLSGSIVTPSAKQPFSWQYYVAAATSVSPYIYVYPFDSTTGFGAKYADPASALVGSAGKVAWNPTGTAITIQTYASPYINTYAWSRSGFGTKYSNPATLPTASGEATFSQDAIVYGSGSSGIYAYPFNTATGYGTKYANAATLPTSVGQAVFNDTFTVIGAGANTPNLIAYPWTSSGGFGTKYADPATLPPQPATSFSWNRAGTAAAVGYQTTTDYTTGTGAAWAFNASTGWGAKYANPATVIDNYYGATGSGFNNNDSVLAFSQYGKSGNNKIVAYYWSNTAGFGTKYSDPPTVQGDGRDFGWTPDGKAIGYAANGGTYLTFYPWNGGFGAKFADMASAPSNTNRMGVGQGY